MGGLNLSYILTSIKKRKFLLEVSLPMNRINQHPGAVILGGHFLSLGAVRNLAKHGVPVCVLDSEVCVARFSRCIRHFFQCPPLYTEDRFINFLMQIAREAH